jgi:hypothetical protein
MPTAMYRSRNLAISRDSGIMKEAEIKFIKEVIGFNTKTINVLRTFDENTFTLINEIREEIENWIHHSKE